MFFYCLPSGSCQFPKELMAKSETSFDFNQLESRKVVTKSITNHYHKFFLKKNRTPRKKKELSLLLCSGIILNALIQKIGFPSNLKTHCSQAAEMSKKFCSCKTCGNNSSHANYRCSCCLVFSNDNSNKKTHEKGSKKRKLHFTLKLYT